MICINNENKDPYFNIALEEYLLKQFKEDIFMLYINKPAVIIGKHQNTVAEINAQCIAKHNIPVIRRISGGGTVYHDTGNLNFTFIRNGESNKLVDFQRYTKYIREVLDNIGLKTYFAKSNSLFTGDKKISGNAEHVYKKRVLHHGTLLYNTNLAMLHEAIKTNDSSIQSRAVQSIRSEVTNILPHLKENIRITTLRKKIFDHVSSQNQDCRFYSLSQADIRHVNQLIETKYGTNKWNYGYSPDYNFNNTLTIDTDNDITIHIKVTKGIITDVTISSDGYGSSFRHLEKAVLNQEHEIHTIYRIVQKTKSLYPEINISANRLISLFFG